MSKLLYIKASPRGDASKSSMLGDAYAAAYRVANPASAIDVIDLATERLPEFDGDKVAAKIATLRGQSPCGPLKIAWDEVAGIAGRFISADRYLISSPMWNGSIPYRLKHYIDIIHQPGLLWRLDPALGYFGLLTNKRATLVLTSGAYSPTKPSPAFGVDHHSAYLKSWLNQAGVTDIDEIRFQPTMLNPDPERSLATALEAAKAAARR